MNLRMISDEYNIHCVCCSKDKALMIPSINAFSVNAFSDKALTILSNRFDKDYFTHCM